MKKSRRHTLKLLSLFPFIPSSISESSLNSYNTSQDIIRKPKLSLNLYSFNDQLQSGVLQLEDVITYCAKQGYSAIDPTAYYFPGYPDVPRDEYLYDFKLKVFNAGLEISGTGIRNNFSDPDHKKRQQDIQLIENWAIASEKMGIPVMRIFAGSPINEIDQKKRAFNWMIDDFKRCADIGSDHGVIIALQNHNEFIKNSDEIIEIIEKVNSPWFRIHLDIGSFRDKNVYQEIEKVIQYAVNWQIKEQIYIDGIAVTPDYVKILQIVKDHHYVGYLPLETLGPGDPIEKLKILKQKVTEAFEKVFS